MSLGKCLYVNFHTEGNFGGGKFNKTILALLKDLFDEVDVYLFPMEMERMQNLKNTLHGYLNGMDARVAAEIVLKASSRRYDWIFLASSNFGKLVRGLRRKNIGAKICVLCNNVEFNFILSQLTTGFRPQLLLTLGATYLSERSIANCADKVIVLNERERKALERLYGRSADAVVPIVLRDEFSDRCGEQSCRSVPCGGCQTGVFIGSNFYANKHAVEWFASHVAPFTPDTFYEIVGKGFESERRLERDNLRIIGTVDDIGIYYERADFVIAPIFKGAGLKVKVAEAMMYGKSILGTPEAFEGYTDVPCYGKVCANADAFIKTINNRDFVAGYNPEARKCFLRLYEYTAVKEKLIKLFGHESEK